MKANGCNVEFYGNNGNSVLLWYKTPRNRFLMHIGWNLICRYGFRLMFKEYESQEKPNATD